MPADEGPLQRFLRHEATSLSHFHGSDMPKTPYAAAGWRTVRLMVLERDAWECRIKLPGCTGKAECVDHIQPWLAGGAWFDPLNLRASCTHCNAVRSTQGRGVDPIPLPPSRDW